MKIYTNLFLFLSFLKYLESIDFTNFINPLTEFFYSM